MRIYLLLSMMFFSSLSFAIQTTARGTIAFGTKTAVNTVWSTLSGYTSKMLFYTAKKTVVDVDVSTPTACYRIDFDVTFSNANKHLRDALEGGLTSYAKANIISYQIDVFDSDHDENPSGLCDDDSFLRRYTYP